MNSSIKIYGSLKWDKNNQILLYDEKIIKLSKSEKILIAALIDNINKPLSSEWLFYEIFGYERDYSIQSIRTLISKLRKKIPVEVIENIYGSEYIIRKSKVETNIQKELDLYLYDILDQINHGVIITDPNQYDNPSIYANKKFYDQFGYEPEDILGKNCRILQHDDTNQGNKAQLREAIKNRTAITTRLVNYKKDKSRVVVELTVNPIFNRKTGNIKFFLGMQKIITD